MTKLGKLYTLAAKMGLDPVQAVALPATVTVVAQKAGISEDGVINSAMNDKEVLDFLKGIVAKIDVAEALA